jgi:polysaccharide biosynthesis transport protein
VYNQNGSSSSASSYVAVLLRRRKVIIWTLAICLVIGLLYAFLTKTVYEASAQLLIDLPSATSSTIDATNPLSSLFVTSQPQSLETQAALLQAIPLLDQTTKETGSATVAVEPVEGTNILQVTARASDPQIAAAFANRLVQLYMEQDSDRSLDEVNAALNFVSDQEAVASQQLHDAETAIKQFKEQHQLTDLSVDRSSQLDQVVSLTASIQKAKSDLAGIESEIDMNQRSFAAEPPATTVLLANTNPEVATLRDSIRDLEVQRAGLTQPGGYTARSPKVMAIDAQISEMKQRLAQQPRVVTTQSAAPNALHEQLHGMIVQLQAQEAETSSELGVLNGQLAQAEQRLGHFSTWELQLAQMNRRHDDAIAADHMFTQQMAELSLRAKAQRANAHVVQEAYVPQTPVAPKRALAILFSVLIGLFLGTCIAIAIEFFDDRLYNSSQADQMLQLPVLGHLPIIPTASARLLPQMQVSAPELESFKVLRTNVLFSAFDLPIRTLLVTSPCPGEGKTTLATNLAYAMAMDGKSVVLVDTDLRQPSVHKQLDAPSSVLGLSDVLAGRAHLKDVLMENTDVPGLQVVLSGTPPANPGELLNTARFRRVCDQLMNEADLVIFDSPPVLSAADSLILASQMDGTLLVVELGETREAAATRAISLLRHARANILGVTYNKIPTGFGGDYYYYNQYAYRGRPSEPSEEQPTALAKKDSAS